MKKTIIALFVIPFFSIIAGCSSSPVAVPDSGGSFTSAEKTIASNSGAFGINLLKNLAASGSKENIVVSPLSISTALGMALNGAGGNTYTQMKSSLQLSGSTQDEINQAYYNINSTLVAIDPKVTFTDANSIWCRKGISFEQSFLDINRKYFSSTVQSLDFASPNTLGIINGWVSDNTNGKIKTIIDQIERADAMYLINAIYFKAEWQSKFDSTNTQQTYFNTPDSAVKCSMMRQENNYNYYAGTNFKALQVPYGSGSYNMLILLPDEGTDVNSILNSADEALVNRISTGFSEKKVQLSLPRFEVSYYVKLKEPLKSLGMTDAFENYADFSKICRTVPLAISDVLHKTYIKVGEEGTEAAAATAVVFKVTSAPAHDNSLIVFSVNRPFIFLITEKTSDAILFAGKIVSPKIE